jgi:hypothetical protein
MNLSRTEAVNNYIVRPCPVGDNQVGLRLVKSQELRAISRDAMAGKNELARMRLAQTVESWHCGLAQNHNISLQMNNLINLSNCKLFLSDNDDSVVLPSQLRPDLPIDFLPPTLGSRCALFSVLHQHSAWRYISSVSFLLMRRAPLLHFLPPTVLSIFYQRRRGYFTFKDSASFGAYIGNLVLLPLVIKDWHPHDNNITIGPPTALEELREQR